MLNITEERDTTCFKNFDLSHNRHEQLARGTTLGVVPTSPACLLKRVLSSHLLQNPSPCPSSRDCSHNHYQTGFLAFENMNHTDGGATENMQIWLETGPG